MLARLPRSSTAERLNSKALICVNRTKLCFAHAGLGATLPQEKGRREMTSAKIRYAIGLVRGAQNLRRALEDLAHEGLPASQLKVLIPEHVLAESREAWRGGEQIPPLEPWTVCRPSAAGACPWQFDLVRTGPDPIGLCGAEPLQGFHRWALQRHAQQLDTHLRDGGAILLVRLLTDREEQTVCRTLLRHAVGGVQTHEVPEARETATAWLSSA
jgi:hypothetical protein